MQTLIINIQNESLTEKVLWMLEHFKSDGLEIIENKEKDEKILNSLDKGLDFSLFKVENLKNIDGLEYQKSIRDEW